MYRKKHTLPSVCQAVCPKVRPGLSGTILSFSLGNLNIICIAIAENGASFMEMSEVEIPINWRKLLFFSLKKLLISEFYSRFK